LDGSGDIYTSWILSFCLNEKDEKSFYPCSINEKQIYLTHVLMSDKYHYTNINERQIFLTQTLIRKKIFLINVLIW